MKHVPNSALNRGMFASKFARLVSRTCLPAYTVPKKTNSTRALQQLEFLEPAVSS